MGSLGFQMTFNLVRSLNFNYTICCSKNNIERLPNLRSELLHPHPLTKFHSPTTPRQRYASRLRHSPLGWRTLILEMPLATLAFTANRYPNKQFWTNNFHCFCELFIITSILFEPATQFIVMSMKRVRLRPPIL